MRLPGSSTTRSSWYVFLSTWSWWDIFFTPMFFTRLIKRSVKTISSSKFSSEYYFYASAFYNTVQIFNPNCWYFFWVLKDLSIHGLKQLFFQLFVKGSYKNIVFPAALSNHFYSQTYYHIKTPLGTYTNQSFYILLPTQMQPHLLPWSWEL